MNDPFHESPTTQPHHGHETTDVSLVAIGSFALGLALVIGLVSAFLHWVFWSLESMEQSRDMPRPTGANATMIRAPKLQARPADELVTFRKNEDQRLSTYAWVDQKHGIARIPIDNAIGILAERGIPEPVGPQVEPKEPTP